ncbi:hypothetical protein A2U01_0111476, partial [Trifolium medium]|nr:hypothetical protein [Trifolium medium]
GGKYLLLSFSFAVTPELIGGVGVTTHLLPIVLPGPHPRSLPSLDVPLQREFPAGLSYIPPSVVRELLRL